MVDESMVRLFVVCRLLSPAMVLPSRIEKTMQCLSHLQDPRPSTYRPRSSALPCSRIPISCRFRPYRSKLLLRLQFRCSPNSLFPTLCPPLLPRMSLPHLSRYQLLLPRFCRLSNRSILQRKYPPGPGNSGSLWALARTASYARGALRATTCTSIDRKGPLDPLLFLLILFALLHDLSVDTGCSSIVSS